MKEILSARLAVIRGTQTKQQFAKSLGIPQNSYLRYEDPNDSTLPKVDILARVSKASGVSADWLLGLKDDKTLRPSSTAAERAAYVAPTRPAQCAKCLEKDEVIKNLSQVMAGMQGRAVPAPAARVAGASCGSTHKAAKAG